MKTRMRRARNENALFGSLGIQRGIEGVNYQPWQTWQPVDRATLCFVVHDGKILLILKKRGLGAGKVNGPGGRIEQGETAEAAAIRETREELDVTPANLSQRGELSFQFADGYSLHCAVFMASEFSGVAVETDEAVPLWTAVSEIPYDSMWEDDRHWLPGMLEGKCFRGRFLFDGERMEAKEIIWGENFFQS